MQQATRQAKAKEPLLKSSTVRKLANAVIVIGAVAGSIHQWLLNSRTNELQDELMQDRAVISWLVKNCQGTSGQSTSKTSERADGSPTSASPLHRSLPRPVLPREVVEELCSGDTGSKKWCAELK